MNEPLLQVGAPDPELRNSPIIDESEYDEQAASPIGAYVQSGAELLQCTGRGVWTRKSEREGPQ